MLEITWVAPETLNPNPHNARTYSKKQVRQITGSISAFGFVVPIVADENQTILLGHGRCEAARMDSLDTRSRRSSSRA